MFDFVWVFKGKVGPVTVRDVFESCAEAGFGLKNSWFAAVEGGSPKPAVESLEDRLSMRRALNTRGSRSEVDIEEKASAI